MKMAGPKISYTSHENGKLGIELCKLILAHCLLIPLKVICRPRLFMQYPIEKKLAQSSPTFRLADI